MNSSLAKGITFSLLTWSLFACMSAFIKISYTYTNTPVAFFCQNFGAFLTLIPYFFLRGTSWLNRENWRLTFLRSALGGISFFCLFLAIKKIPLTDATLLNNTAPLFVPFLAALILNTTLRLPIFVCTLVGFTGVLMILKPSDGFFCLEAFPALLSGIASAIVMIVMRQLKGENPRKILFTYLALISLASAPFALPHLLQLPLVAWIPLSLAGICFGFGQLFLTWSSKHAEPTVLAPLSYTFVVGSGILDWAIWSHSPGMASAIGILLVLSGGILTIFYSRKPVVASCQQ